LVFRIFRLTTGTQSFMLSFLKCLFTECIHVVCEFSGVVSLIPPTRVHPLSVIHPLTSDITSWWKNRNLRRFYKVDCFYTLSIMLVVGKDRS
jgi:hypothetical protein